MLLRDTDSVSKEVKMIPLWDKWWGEDMMRKLQPYGWFVTDVHGGTTDMVIPKNNKWHIKKMKTSSTCRIRNEIFFQPKFIIVYNKFITILNIVVTVHSHSTNYHTEWRKDWETRIRLSDFIMMQFPFPNDLNMLIDSFL